MWYHVWREEYVQNPSLRTCEGDKDCKIDEYLKNCTLIKSIVFDLVIICNEIMNVSETASIYSIDKKVAYETNHCPLCTLLLATMCLLLLTVTAINCYSYKKQRSTTHYLIPY